LVASSFRTRAALQAEILALRHQLAVFQKECAASLAPPPLRPTVPTENPTRGECLWNQWHSRRWNEAGL